jgi:hypothetical protein
MVTPEIMVLKNANNPGAELLKSNLQSPLLLHNVFEMALTSMQ